MTTSGPRPVRSFHRFPFDADVLLFSEQQRWRGGLLDLSLKGLLIERPAGWDGRPGDPFRAEVILESGIRITMAVTTARCDHQSVGFRCTQIDMNSFGHLKRLVELNLGDTERLERELESLGPVGSTIKDSDQIECL